MYEKKISVKFDSEMLVLLDNVVNEQHCNYSDAIRDFITKDKIVIVKDFEKILPVLIKLTKLIESGEVSNNEISEGVVKLWQLLNIATQSLSED